MTAIQYFFLGATSVFSFDRVRLFSFDYTDIERDLKNIHSFGSDADAIRSDFENVGRDIQKSVLKYEQQTTTPEEHETV